MRLRIAIGAIGVLLGLFGVFRLLTEISAYDLVFLFIWLIGALIIHDGLLAPVVVGVGTVIAKVVPARGRRFLQGGLIAAALITAVALPMIYRARTSPSVKAILEQNFAGNLGVLLLIVLVGTLLLYLASVLRAAHAPNATNTRPPADQDSSSE